MPTVYKGGSGSAKKNAVRDYLPKRAVRASTAPEVAARLVVLLTRHGYAARRVRARVKALACGAFRWYCTRVGVAAHKTMSRVPNWPLGVRSVSYTHLTLPTKA